VPFCADDSITGEGWTFAWAVAALSHCLDVAEDKMS
jgi:hypothetical protein